jgi:hypothetical protein
MFMMRILLTVFCLLSWLALSAQAANADKEVAAKRKALEVKPAAAPASKAPSVQAAYWKRETLANPQNAQAWASLAVWSWRNSGIPFTTGAILEDIPQNAAPHIQGSGEYALIQFLKNNKNDSAAIYTALAKMSDKKLVYPFIIQSDIIRGNMAELKKHCAAFQQLQPITVNSATYHYHYNVLQSAVTGGVIAASGENDLVPLAMMQMVHGVRTDVRLQYLRPDVLQQNGVYICLSAGAALLKANPQRLAYSGLLVKTVSAEAASDVSLSLRADQLQLDYLERQAFTGQQAALHNNYLPALILAWKQYQAGGDAKAEYYKKIILKIATEGGRLAAVEAQLKETPGNP